MLLSLSGCKKKPLEFYITSDNHYFSNSLHDSGELYNLAMLETPMLIEYNNEILDEFIEVIKEKPLPYLIMAGDLTFNGELESLKELSFKLKEIEDLGTEVLVIPGNHDMYYKYARGYEDDHIVETAWIENEDYLALMGDFGYNEAEYKDPATFSYIKKLDEDNYVLMLDANHFGTRGSIDKNTIEWADQVLTELNGKHVFAVCHQPIITPFDKSYFGYEIYNPKEMIKLFRNHDISELYVGHIHSERDKTVDGVHQQTVTSLLIDDVRYSTIEIDEGKHTYQSYQFGTYGDEGMKKHELIVARKQVQ